MFASSVGNHTMRKHTSDERLRPGERNRKRVTTDYLCIRIHLHLVGRRSNLDNPPRIQLQLQSCRRCKAALFL